MANDTELLAADIKAWEEYEEMMNADIGCLCYRGNSVSHWHAKAKANGRALLAAWDALREAGIAADGKTDVATAIRKLARQRGRG